MKKIVSLAMAGIMLLGACPMVYAADVDYQAGTNVTVVGDGGEYYVTVPASLESGQTGTVRAYGKWASDETVKVWTEDTVEVTHTETGAKTDVNVTFAGIESLGNDLEDMDVTASISIDKGEIRFGEWTGTIVYNVEFVGATTEKTYNVKTSDSNIHASIDADTQVVSVHHPIIADNASLLNTEATAESYVKYNGTEIEFTSLGAGDITFEYQGDGSYEIYVAWQSLTTTSSLNFNGTVTIVYE